MFLAGILFVALSALAAGSAFAGSIWDTVPDSSAPGDTLSLASALTRVKHASPALRAQSLRIAAAGARIEQAGAWSNPLLSLEAENVGGSFDGFDRSELSLRLQQEIALGGKRSRLAGVASSESIEVRRDSDAQAFELFVETRARYARIVHAEARGRLLVEAESVVAELAESAESRVRSGATLLADAALASAALARARNAIADADAERMQARAALSTLWGDSRGFDEPVERSLDAIAAPIPADSADAWAARSPSVLALQAQAGTRRAEAALERSLRVPDLMLEAGVRRLEAEDANTFLFTVGVPIPAWDRRGAAVNAADAEVGAADAEIERVRAATSGALVARISELSRMRERVRQMEATLIPSLTTALDNMRTAYGIGRASYADLLEVQRTLIELRNDVNDTRRDMVTRVIEIEMLAGRPIEELMGK